MAFMHVNERVGIQRTSKVIDVLQKGKQFASFISSDLRRRRLSGSHRHVSLNKSQTKVKWNKMTLAMARTSKVKCVSWNYLVLVLP